MRKIGALKNFLFKKALQHWPCIKASGVRILRISQDFHEIDIAIPLTWKTRNRVGTIYGGSLYSATDAFYFLMLMEILGKEFVVWDKSGTIQFKRPGRSTLYGYFRLDPDQIRKLKHAILEQGEITRDFRIELVDAEGVIHSEITRTIYLATKDFYKKKMARKSHKQLSLESSS